MCCGNGVKDFARVTVGDDGVAWIVWLEDEGRGHGMIKRRRGDLVVSTLIWFFIGPVERRLCGRKPVLRMSNELQELCGAVERGTLAS
jgi:hypothetical protein